MKRNILAVALGVLLALVVSIAYREDSLENMRFNLGIFEKEETYGEVEKTIQLFNQYYAKFFNTGGDFEGLGIFPAANPVKRRVVQDIDSWKKQGKVLVYDKDVFELQSVTLVTPDLVVALAREVWFLNVQDLRTRKKLKGVKANPIRVRYIVRRHDGEWKIDEFEIFNVDDILPPVNLERFLL